MDDEEKAMLNYKPPISHMKTAMWVLWFIFLTAMILWNQSETPADPWFTWGGWFTSVAIALIALAPLIVSRDSPKITSNKLGSTVASPDPIQTIPAQSGHPAYGIWAGGSVKSWFVYEFATTTRAYIIAPLALAYTIGDGGKGVNVFINAHLEQYIDHTQLPPHILDGLESMKKPSYNPSMPILYGWWPMLTNPIDPKEYKEYREHFRNLGLPEDKIEDAMRFVEMASQKLTKFRYDEQLTNMESNLLRREKIVNSENADLKKMIEYLKKENRDLYESKAGPRKQGPPPSIFQMPRREEPEQDDDDRNYEPRRNDY